MATANHTSWPENNARASAAQGAQTFRFKQPWRWYKASIRIRPRYPYAYNNLGTAYAGVGDYQEAIAAFNAAIELKPDFFWSRYNRAKAFAVIGAMDKAAGDYEYLLHRDPNNQDIKNRLLTVQSSLGSSQPGNLAAPPSPILVDHPSLVEATTPDATLSIPLKAEGGIFVVPVLINDAITLDFVVDSGAADVSIPEDVVSTLMRTGTLKETDFLEEKTYVLADGSRVPSQTFRIRSLKVGNRVLTNVTGSVSAVQGSLLIGQSFLSRFKSWSVDNTEHSLVLK